MSNERLNNNPGFDLDIKPSDLDVIDHNSLETPADRVLDGLEHDDTSIGPDDGDGLGQSGPYGSDED